MSLSSYLQRAGLVTGPLAKHTSHSAMEVTKRFLLCIPQFKGNESFLTFGSAAHETYYTHNFQGAFLRLPDEDKQRILNMLKKLHSHPIAKALRTNAVCEQKLITEINGVPVTVILDAEQAVKFRASDLKTTSCRSQKDFEIKAREYGYPRQGTTYKVGRRLKLFYFIGICTQPPHDVYVYDLNGDKDAVRYAEQELAFLLYFYKHYGKFIIK